jgi:hypothetical protein
MRRLARLTAGATGRPTADHTARFPELSLGEMSR